MKSVKWMLCCIFAATTSCASPAPIGQLSESVLKELQRSAGISSAWRVEEEEGDELEKIDRYIYVFEDKVGFSGLACGSRVHILGVRKTGDLTSLVRHDQEWQIALRKCDEITLEDLRPIIGDVDEQSIETMVSIITSVLPFFGNHSASQRFQSAELVGLFDRLSPSELLSITFTTGNRLTLTFGSPEVAPESLGVRITSSHGAQSVFVYRENGPDTVR